MIVPDLNLLIYAYDADASRHASARAVWEECLNGEELVGIAWVTILGFLRLATHPTLQTRPLPVSAATAIVRSWLARPNVEALEAGAKHAERLLGLLERIGTGGNLTSDAHLAAIAIEHGATLYSTDADFARFPGLSWTDPLRPVGDQGRPARSKRLRRLR